LNKQTVSNARPRKMLSIPAIKIDTSFRADPSLPKDGAFSAHTGKLTLKPADKLFIL